MSQKIKDFLSGCEVEFIPGDIGEVVFAAPPSDENNELLEQLRDIFLSAGYANESLAVRSYGAELELTFKLGSSFWKRGQRIFEKLSDLWESCQLEQSVPDTFFVDEVREIVRPGETFDLLKKFEVYFLWVRLLKRLSEDGSGNELKYFVASEGALKRHTISVYKSFEGIQSASIPLDSAQSAEELIGQLDIVDAHETQRRQVMLSTLSSLLDDHSGRDPVCWVIEHEASFKRKFYENYEIYTKSFSVDKLLTEVFEKQNEYTSKVLENVSSNQAKALALPGGLIAVGALVRSANAFSLLLICVGLYVVYIFTKSANSISRDALNNLDAQIDRAFRDYIKSDVENEVVSGAGEAKGVIRKQIVSAVERLDMIDAWALCIFFFGCFFTVLGVFSMSQLIGALELFVSIVQSWAFMLINVLGALFSQDSEEIGLLTVYLENFV